MGLHILILLIFVLFSDTLHSTSPGRDVFADEAATPKSSDSLTRERPIELYEAVLRQACDDFDLFRDDIDFADDEP